MPVEDDELDGCSSSTDAEVEAEEEVAPASPAPAAVHDLVPGQAPDANEPPPGAMDADADALARPPAPAEDPSRVSALTAAYHALLASGTGDKDAEAYLLQRLRQEGSRVRAPQSSAEERLRASGVAERAAQRAERQATREREHQLKALQIERRTAEAKAQAATAEARV
eukprot:13110189-Alexandrium_andersonii.AAC.1